jgi:hypothetical protein
VDSQKWEVALHRHAAYVPERKILIAPDPASSRELNQVCCRKKLERAGLPEKLASAYAQAATTVQELYQLDRAARLLEAFADEQVLPHVAVSLVRRALDEGAGTENGIRLLDYCEIAIDVGRQKKNSRQNVRNLPGLLVKVARDPHAAPKIISQESIEASCAAYRQREAAVLAQQRLAEQKGLLSEFEQFREDAARAIFDDLPEPSKTALRKEKVAVLKQQGRLDKLDVAAREQEVDELICNDIARKQVPPFEKWYARKRARQAVLPFVAEAAS